MLYIVIIYECRTVDLWLFIHEQMVRTAVWGVSLRGGLLIPHWRNVVHGLHPSAPSSLISKYMADYHVEKQTSNRNQYG